MSYLLIRGDARRIPLADGSVHCVVTSPPYFGLRDYGTPGQIGLEPTPDAFVAAMVGVFREVYRVLRDDAVCWLNLGDSYATGAGSARSPGGDCFGKANQAVNSGAFPLSQPNRMPLPGLKPKDLIGIPWRVAFALQADGWYLRSDVIWSKPSPMPESVRDRPTKSHEYLFLLTKSERYYYDNEAIREAMVTGPSDIKKMTEGLDRIGGKHGTLDDPLLKASVLTEIGRKRSVGHPEQGRNKRTVWEVASQPFPGSHFATFPPKLIEPCVKAGTSEKGCCPACGSPWLRQVERTPLTRERPNDFVKRTGAAGTGNSCANSVAGVSVVTTGWISSCPCPAAGPVPCTVYDPFGGAMTTVVVAEALGRRGVATELSADYIAMGRRRLDRPHAPPEPVAAGRAESFPLFD